MGELRSSWAEPNWISTGKSLHGKRSQMCDRVFLPESCTSGATGSVKQLQQLRRAGEPMAGDLWETPELRLDRIPADPGWRHKAAFTEPFLSVRTCSGCPSVSHFMSSTLPVDLQTPMMENRFYLFKPFFFESLISPRLPFHQSSLRGDWGENINKLSDSLRSTRG